MTKGEFKAHVTDAFSQFEDPQLLQNKHMWFFQQLKDKSPYQPHIAILADSRILMSPELIFSQDLGVTCIF